MGSARNASAPNFTRGDAEFVTWLVQFGHKSCLSQWHQSTIAILNVSELYTKLIISIQEEID